MNKLDKFLRWAWNYWSDTWAWRKLKAGLVSTSSDPIAVYFDGGAEEIYQIAQWVAPLSVLRLSHPVTVICRTKIAAIWALKKTPFKVVFCPHLTDLLAIYQKNSFLCILYVNNAHRNFQSLINGKTLHVHINHGESEKRSTFSNQTKAYDYVLVAGQAAIDKYNLNLIKKDINRYQIIGRPQLEHTVSLQLPAPKKNYHTTVLYAPTWEGAYGDMDYSSLNTLGLSLVEILINTPGFRVIYRPHPSTGKRLPGVAVVNRNIIKAVSAHQNGLFVPEGDINGLFSQVDVAIFDNSAVAVDYLVVGKPMIMTNFSRKASDGRFNQSLMKEAATLLSADGIPEIASLIIYLQKKDPKAVEREFVRQQFLGSFNYMQKESTRIFVEIVASICEECQRLNNQIENNLSNHGRQKNPIYF
jgi:hypothetical protein